MNLAHGRRARGRAPACTARMEGLSRRQKYLLSFRIADHHRRLIDSIHSIIRFDDSFDSMIIVAKGLALFSALARDLEIVMYPQYQALLTAKFPSSSFIRVQEFRYATILIIRISTN